MRPKTYVETDGFTQIYVYLDQCLCKFQVFLCCKSLLKSDSDPEVRKAAAVALTLLLQGLGQDILKVRHFWYMVHRGSYMCVHVLLNLLNKMAKRDKM